MIMKGAGLENEQARRDQWSKMVQTAIIMEDKIFKHASNAMAYDQDVKNRMTNISKMSTGQQGGGGMRPPTVMQQPHVLVQQQRQNGGMLNAGNFTPGQAQMAPTFVSNDQRQMNLSQQDMYQMNQNFSSRLAQQGQQPLPNPNRVSAPSNRPQISYEDQQYIVKLTNHLMQQAQANPGTMQNLHSHISNMPPDERNKLGPNPMRSMFQRKAMAMLIQRKTQQASQSQGVQLNDPARHQQSQSMNGNSNAAFNQARTENSAAAFDSAQFAGLQEQAMRSQASGDLVVPATNNQFAHSQQASFQSASNQGDQNFQQLNGPVRHPVTGQSMGQGQMNEHAPAKIRAQAHMSQSNLPQQRTPQQERLHGQGLHSSQPGQQPSPLALLNRPLQDQILKTPQPNQARLDQSSGNAMQQTLQNGPEGRAKNPQEQAQSQMNGNVLKLLPQLQNVYHSLPPQVRMQMAGMDAFKLQQLLTGWWNKHRQSMAGNPSGQGSLQRDTLDVTNGGQKMSQGSGVPQQFKLNPTLNQAPQIPQGFSKIDTAAQNSGRSMPNMNPNALSLPRDKINIHFPGLQIPPPIQKWGNFIQWIKESNAIPQERYPELNRIRQAQLHHLTEEHRMRLESAAPLSTSIDDQPIEELLKNPVFLGTPQIDLDPASISRRPVVRDGLVPLIGGLPQMPNPGPADIAVARTATKMADNEIARHLRNRRLQQIRQLDPDMWREIHRTNHLRSMHTPPNNQVYGRFQGITTGPQFQQSSNMGPGLRGTNQAGQNARQTPTGRPSNAPKNMPVPAKGLHSHDMSEKLGQHSSQFSAPSNSKQNAMNYPDSTSEQWARMNPEQKQKEMERMQHVSNQAIANRDEVPPQQGSRPSLNPQLLDEFNRLSEAALQGIQLVPPRQYDAAEGEQFRHEIKKNNLQELFVKFATLGPMFYSKYRSKQDALDVLKGVVYSAHLVKKQDFHNHRYNVTIDEFRDHISKVQKFVNALTTTGQNGQQQARSSLPPPSFVQDEKVQVKSQSQSSSRRDSKSNVPPPAPTAERAPYSFDRHTSPHGTPRYGTNSTFDPTKIAIPQERQNKRKHGADSAKATPTLPQVKLQESGKIMPPQKSSQTPPAIQMLPYKCPVPRCDREVTGFGTQEEADKHAKEVHSFEGDELEWCLDMLRGALNLDAVGQPKPKSTVQNMELASGPNASLITVAGSNTKSSTQSAAGPIESAAAAWKRQQAQRERQPTPSVAIQKPKSSIGGSVQPVDSNIAGNTDPAETWKNSNIQLERLDYLFSELDDFPSRGLDAFAGIQVDPPSFPLDAPGFTVKSLEEKAMAQQKEISKSPGEVLQVRMEDYNPFPVLNGGVDPYDGRQVEIIRDDEPFVPVESDEFMKSIMSPEKMKEMQREQAEEKRRTKEDNWFDICNPQIDDFLNMDGEVGSEQEDGTPPKRLKKSPELA